MSYKIVGVHRRVQRVEERKKKQPYCSRWFTCGSDSVLYYIILYTYYVYDYILQYIYIYRAPIYTHSLTWTRARRYIVSAAAANTVRVVESPCSDDIITKLIIHTAAAVAVGQSVGRVFCGSRSPKKRGRGGHCCTTCALTAGGNRLLSTRTKYEARTRRTR